MNLKKISNKSINKDFQVCIKTDQIKKPYKCPICLDEKYIYVYIDPSFVENPFDTFKHDGHGRRYKECIACSKDIIGEQ